MGAWGARNIPVSDVPLVKVSVATAQPEGAGYWELGTQARVPWEASAFPFTWSLNKQMKNALSCARQGWSGAELVALTSR